MCNLETMVFIIELCSAGHIQTSESFLLKVREYGLPEFSIEKAKHMKSEVIFSTYIAGIAHAVLIFRVLLMQHCCISKSL